MKIIYHCFGGSHSSVLAAAVHLKLLANDIPPGPEDMMRLPYFDKTDNADFGTIRYMGLDELGHQIYVLGKKNLGERCTIMITEVARLLGEGAEVMAVNCTNRVNLAMMIGGFVSRRLGFPRIGRPILFYGSRGAFYQIVNLVEITRLKACHKAGEENCT